jgi:plastocyanin
MFYLLERTLIISDVMKRSKLSLVLILIGLLYIVLTPYAVVAAPSVYNVLVDDTYGFKDVRIEPNDPVFKYYNLTLMINQGDKVVWINDAYDPSGNAYDNNIDMTIVSVQNLWDNQSGYLEYYLRSFNYTFNQPGTYEVYMKEYPLVHNQTIVVAPLETPAITTPSSTPTEKETFAPTASITQTPKATPGFDFWNILLALIVVAFIHFFKRK